METKEIADRLVSLVREGKFKEAMEELYHPEIISLEEGPDMRECVGTEAVAAKGAWWDSTYEVHGVQVEGPWVNDPCFLIKLTMDTEHRETKEKTRMTEFCLYSVHEDKIKHERFFSVAFEPLS